MCDSMKDEECLFCKIVSGSMPSYRIWEDSEYMAILDIFPNIRGQTLVIPKMHVDSYAFGMKTAQFMEFMEATKKVANLLEQKLGVKRVHMVLEGTAVNHLHAKLYPAIGYGDFAETVVEKNVRFDSYPGFVTTLMGPRASDKELKALQKQITG